MVKILIFIYLFHLISVGLIFFGMYVLGELIEWEYEEWWLS